MRSICFFDIDGTISAPRFRHNNSFVMGFSLQNWIRFCNEQKEHAYDYCAVVQPIIDFARDLKDRNWRNVILTVAKSDGEKLAKRAFLKNRKLIDTGILPILPLNEIHAVSPDTPVPDGTVIVRSISTQPDLFDAIIFVDNDMDKIPVMLAYGEDPSVCALVDDTQSILWPAHDAGIQAIHPVNILTGTITC